MHLHQYLTDLTSFNPSCWEFMLHIETSCTVSPQTEPWDNDDMLFTSEARNRNIHEGER